ncbi:MAG: DNA polymerase II large subunit [Nitrososphaerales archaeon]
MSNNYLQYVNSIIKNFTRAFQVAKEAKNLGFDPSLDVECEPALDLAERVEKLLKINVGERLRELSSQYKSEVVALRIAEEVALGKFGFFDIEEALDLGIRIGLAVVTEGVTVAPIQGIYSVKIKRNDDGTPYVAIYFAGPIRSAGGTEAAFTLLIADHIRRTLGLDRYKVTEEEVGRFIEELRIYERDVGNFQYKVSDEDIRLALNNLPIEVTGVETDPVEIVVHRRLKRVETDRVRGGALRVVNDGVIGRSRKLLKLVKELNLPEWEWLDLLKGGLQQGVDETKTSHFEEIISGRPVLSFPRREGGFRLRYGRCFNMGLSAIGIHPVVAILLDYAVVSGTQVKLDLPGKAATIAFVDSIEPPIVKLKDGSVIKVDTLDKAKEIKDRLDKILYLGDILISYGDFLENNFPLQPSGYTEEWWKLELKLKNVDLEEIAKVSQIDLDRLRKIIELKSNLKPTFNEAIKLSQILNMPLHPSYLFFWNLLKVDEILKLRNGIRKEENGLIVKKECKDILEKAGICHRVEKENGNDKIIVSSEDSEVLKFTLNLGSESIPESIEACDFLTKLCGIKIMPKVGTFVGVRVGRPEKASLRKMKPPVHLLFPVGNEGGATRNLIKAADNKLLNIEMVNAYCPNCSTYSPSFFCRNCGSKVTIQLICPICKKELKEEYCESCKVRGVAFKERIYPLKESLNRAIERVRYYPEPPLKGVKALTSSHKFPEPIEKGILRNKYSLYVYKDGTIRFDATNLVLTHFKPKFFNIPLEKLKELGYTKDMDGKELVSDEQILELKPQDVIIPYICAKHLLRVSKFIDELLLNFYKKDPFYSLEREEDLLGHLIVGLAPHTSAGVIGRVIGFTDLQTCLAHPYWHSAKRRDCDGDEDSIMLLLDTLLNFSKEYLPDQIGGFMDAPLSIQLIVLPDEIQRQAHNFDLDDHYPLELYLHSWEKSPPQKVEELIDTVRKRLRKESQYEGFKFTHDTNVLSLDVSVSIYSRLKTMQEKIDKQIELATKIRAVNPHEVVSFVLETHIIPDIIGNLRAYVSQSFKCKNCGSVFRRFPIKGSCLNCGGDLQLSVTRSSIEKYLNLGRKLCEQFDVSPYIKTRMREIVNELNSLFPPDKTVQSDLTSFL